MATVGWLVKGKHSGKAIITAPDAPAGVAASVERLDLALNGFTRPQPRWYLVIEKTGYWWYLICMIVGVAVLLFVPNTPIEYQIAAGMGLGLLVALPGGWLLRSVAQAVDRRKSGTTPEKVERKLKGVARRINTDAQSTVDTILDRAPQREADVHDALWRSAAGSDAAFSEIEALIAQVAPELAAERRAATEELAQQFEDLKKQGKA